MQNLEFGQRFEPKFGTGGSVGEGYRGMESWSMGERAGSGWVSGCVCIVVVDWSFGHREDVVGIGDIPCSSLCAHLYS